MANTEKDEETAKTNMKAIIGKSVQKEERATGAVPWSVYKKYISQSGVATSILMLTMFILAQGFKMLGDWYILS